MPALLRSVAAVGDVNGDNVTDLLVGADGTSNTGGAWLLFMKNDSTTVLDNVVVGDDSPSSPVSLTSSSYYGTSVAGIGDLDGTLCAGAAREP